MANIFTKIQRKVARGEYQATIHFLEELDDEFFTLDDAKAAIFNAFEFEKLTAEESHIRYVFYGFSLDGRKMKIITFIRQGKVMLKSAYEYLG